MRPEPSNETLNQGDPYGWANTMRETVDDSDNGKPLAMHIVPRHSVVGLVLRKGKMECRSAQHAKGIVHKALKQGMPIDYSQRLDGTWVVYLSRKGTDFIRQKHGIVERKARSPKRVPTLRKSIEVLTDLTGLDQGIVIDMLKTVDSYNSRDANEVVKAYARMKKEGLVV